MPVVAMALHQEAFISLRRRARPLPIDRRVTCCAPKPEVEDDVETRRLRQQLIAERLRAL